MGNSLCKGRMGNRVSPRVKDGSTPIGPSNLIDEYRDNIHIGRSHKHVGETSCAIVHFKRCLQISQIIKKGHMEIEALSELGVAFYEIGEHEKAIDAFIDMHECSKGAMDRKGIKTASLNLAVVYEIVGQNDKAIDMYKEHIRNCSEIGKSSETTLIHYDVAVLYRKMNDVENAMEHLTIAWDYVSSHRNWDERLAVSSELADLSYKMGKVEDALQYREEELKAATKLNANESKQLINSQIGNIYLGIGKYADAEFYFNEALRSAKQTKNRLLIAKSHDQLHSLCKVMKKKEDARYHKKQANSFRKLDS